MEQKANRVDIWELLSSSLHQLAWHLLNTESPKTQESNNLSHGSLHYIAPLHAPDLWLITAVWIVHTHLISDSKSLEYMQRKAKPMVHGVSGLPCLRPVTSVVLYLLDVWQIICLKNSDGIFLQHRRNTWRAWSWNTMATVAKIKCLRDEKTDNTSAKIWLGHTWPNLLKLDEWCAGQLGQVHPNSLGVKTFGFQRRKQNSTCNRAKNKYSWSPD